MDPEETMPMEDDLAQEAQGDATPSSELGAVQTAEETSAPLDEETTGFETADNTGRLPKLDEALLVADEEEEPLVDFDGHFPAYEAEMGPLDEPELAGDEDALALEESDETVLLSEDGTVLPADEETVHLSDDEDDETTLLSDADDEETTLLPDGDEETILLPDNDEETTLLTGSEDEEAILPPKDEVTVLLNDGEETVLFTSNTATTVLPFSQEEMPVISADEGDGGKDALEALKAKEGRHRELSRKNLVRLVAIVALSIMLCGIVGYGVIEALRPKILVPQTAEVEYRDFVTVVQGQGALRPTSSVLVTPEVTGTVDTVYVSEGQTVKKDDVLFTIKNDSLDKAINDTSRQVTSAETALNTANEALAEVQKSLDDARAINEAQKAQAEADKKNAEEAYNQAYNNSVAWANQRVSDMEALYDQAVAHQTDAQNALSNAAVEVDVKNKELDKALKEQNKAADALNADLENESKRKAYEDADKAYNEALAAAEQAQADYDNANLTLSTANDGVANAHQNLEQARNERVSEEETARKAGEQARAAVTITQVEEFNDTPYITQIETAQQSVIKAKEAYDAAVSAYNKAVETANKRTVKAPTYGTITLLTAKTGGAVQQQPYVEISDVSQMKVTIGVSELDIATIKAGQRADITFAALPETKLAGEVLFSGPTGVGSNDTSNFPVELLIRKPAPDLKVGMTADVIITTQSVPDALVVPLSALIEGKGTTKTTYVDVLVDPETYTSERREVTTGERSATEIVITSGLKPGETLVIPNGFGWLDQTAGLDQAAADAS